MTNVKNIYFSDQNLCSIAGVEPNRSGEAILREVTAHFLATTPIVIARVERPATFAIRPTALNAESTIKLKNLRHDDDWFSLSFEYYPKSENDLFLDLVIELWFTYEQPMFAFLTKRVLRSMTQISASSQVLTWQEIAEEVSSFVIHKGIEDDVIWIGKSDELSFGFPWV